MDFLKSKVLLKKINTLHERADSFNQNLSTLEKDLMLQYLRDLYECISEDQSERSSKTDSDPTISKIKTSQIVEPIREATPQRNVPETNGHHQEEMRSPHSEKVIEETQTAVAELDPEIKELFAESHTPEASSRFANIPIDDISKAFGINEKILTINELFGSNQQLFQQVVQKLNGMSTFEEAKQFLAYEIAPKHNWTSKKKSKKALDFLNTVRRRYL